MAQKIIPIRSSTQTFIEIEDVNHDLALFVDGSAAMILTTAAVNFGLLSEKEQEAIIYAYAGLLNSLSFPIQIIVRSQHKDVTSYLRLLDQQEKKQKNPKLASSIKSYRLFVAETVKEKEVIDKKFYIVIPFSSLELGISTKVLFGSKKKGLPYEKNYIFDKALMILSPKRDQVTRLLHRIGLKVTQLGNEQIVQLLFSIYNPETQVPSAETIRNAKPQAVSGAQGPILTTHR